MPIRRRILIAVLLVALPCLASADADLAPPIVAVQPVELLGFPDDRTATGLAVGLTRIVETRLEATGVETRAPGASEASGVSVLETTLTQIGTGYSIDLTLRNAAGNTLWSGFDEADDLDQVRDKLPELVREAGENAPRSEAPVPTPPVVVPPAAPLPPATPPAVTQVLDLELSIMGFDLCDLDGDGALEAVVVTENDVTVLETSDGALVPGATFESGWLDRYIAVDCLDVDGDEAAEIVVTNRRHGGFRSLVLERAADGTLTVAAEGLPFALRGVPDSAGHRSLHAQNFPVPGSLYGPVWPARLSGDELERETKLVTPKRPNVGALVVGHPALGALGPDEAGPRMLTVVHDGRLRLFTGKRALWSAEGLYGGYDLSFEQPNAVATAGDAEVRVHLRDRIEVARTGDDWTLITTKVIAPLGNLMPRLELGRVVTLGAFQWDGQTLRPVELPFNYVSASHSEGTIKDLRVADWTGDGIDDLVLGVAISEEFWSLFGNDASQLLVYPGSP